MQLTFPDLQRKERCLGSCALYRKKRRFCALFNYLIKCTVGFAGFPPDTVNGAVGGNGVMWWGGGYWRPEHTVGEVCGAFCAGVLWGVGAAKVVVILGVPQRTTLPSPI